MTFDRRWMQLRDVFAMREHNGWAYYLTQKAMRFSGTGKRLLQSFHDRLSEHTDMRSAAFDLEYGTDTFTRAQVRVSESVSPEEMSWGYGPVNQDFFREMMNAIKLPLSPYAFIDVGVGKGAALMLASEYAFRRYIGVDINEDLIRAGRANVAAFNARTQRTLDPEWVRCDFMRWPLPPEDSLFFLNNPFPDALSLEAVEHISVSLRDQPRRALLVYRKAPSNVGDYLHRSKLWTPLRLAPYWRIYASPTLAKELAS
jgi:SAM-dependent methyltransferase